MTRTHHHLHIVLAYTHPSDRKTVDELTAKLGIGDIANRCR